MDGLSIYVLIVLTGAGGCAALGWWVADQKGRAPVEGVILGFFFGPLGVLIVALLPAVSRPAPRRTLKGKGHRSRPVVAVPEMPADWQPEAARDEPPVPEEQDDDEKALRYLTGPE